MNHDPRRIARGGRSWDDLAVLDPLWATLAAPGKRHGRWELADYFKTGEDEIDAVLAAAKTLGRPDHRRSSLDFGCGLGRTTRALGKYFEHCEGIDASAQMIARARELNGDCANCSFLVSTDSSLGRFRPRTFDFVYSSFVLQHLPNRELAIGYIREFLRIVRQDGLVVFQMPPRLSVAQRVQLRPRLYSGLRALGLPKESLYNALRLHPVRMIALSELEVDHTVQECGGTVGLTTPVDDGDQLSGLRYYVRAG